MRCGRPKTNRAAARVFAERRSHPGWRGDRWFGAGPEGGVSYGRRAGRSRRSDLASPRGTPEHQPDRDRAGLTRPWSRPKLATSTRLGRYRRARAGRQASCDRKQPLHRTTGQQVHLHGKRERGVHASRRLLEEELCCNCIASGPRQFREFGLRKGFRQPLASAVNGRAGNDRGDDDRQLLPPAPPRVRSARMRRASSPTGPVRWRSAVATSHSATRLACATSSGSARSSPPSSG